MSTASPRGLRLGPGISSAATSATISAAPPRAGNDVSASRPSKKRSRSPDEPPQLRRTYDRALGPPSSRLKPQRDGIDPTHATSAPPPPRSSGPIIDIVSGDIPPASRLAPHEQRFWQTALATTVKTTAAAAVALQGSVSEFVWERQWDDQTQQWRRDLKILHTFAPVNYTRRIPKRGAPATRPESEPTSPMTTTPMCSECDSHHLRWLGPRLCRTECEKLLEGEPEEWARGGKRSE